MAAKVLNDELYEQVELLSEAGNEFADDEEYDAAIEKFKEALDIIPQPKSAYEGAAWLYSSIGDLYFLKDDFENAAENFAASLNCEDGKTSAFAQMRLGQSLLEMKDEDKAFEHLYKAYRLGGKPVFAEEDSKYLSYLSKRGAKL
ncbi:hypothetical protein LX64_00487 [Chitinophaga skermanii]|uniref:Uncharacterized protein n=1 Tax=Chitinophaga skermanii TaxID=331697 RepID=A0A327R2H8_9BACT|nr:hypothetical protein [Chitinophaga skermanii]RAJ10880.1 hypothetical protein LX64_00487 [Chitinophaga skermanii]